jgi:hypothetical protein
MEKVADSIKCDYTCKRDGETLTARLNFEVRLSLSLSRSLALTLSYARLLSACLARSFLSRGTRSKCSVTGCRHAMVQVHMVGLNNGTWEHPWLRAIHGPSEVMQSAVVNMQHEC